MTSTTRTTTDVPVRQMLVGGSWVEAGQGRLVDVVDPTSEQVLARVPQADADDVDRAVQSARHAGAGWAALPWTRRAAALRELAGRIRDRAEHLAMLDTTDSGNPITGMRGDVRKAAEEVDYFAGLGGELKGDTIPWTADQFAQSTREPYGVVGRITAFNHPFMFGVGKSAAPLMAGNAVVLKPSEHTSLSSLELGAMAEDLLPPGVLNVVTGTGAETGAALAAHADVPRVAFTGGVTAGQAVLAAGVPHLKHVSLELGGKNPMIVFPDVDVEQAASAAVSAMNLRRSMGQSCQSSSRLLVHADIADRFIEQLVAEVETLTVGDPRRDDTDMGPLAYQAHWQRVLGYVEKGREDGATLVTGGRRPADLDRGYFVAPTVFTDVHPEMRIAQEEIFGPVISVIRWHDYDDMLATANNVRYGLTANVWTRDLSTAHRTARRLHAGLVWVNGDGTKPAGVPFGGYKHSGLGKEGSLSELLSYTREKATVITLR